MELLMLDDEENFEKLCGEVFLTTKGNIILFCTLCELIYKNYDSYVDHLNEKHLSVESFQENLDQEEKKGCADDNSMYIDNEDSVSFIKFEIEPSEQELTGDELPIASIEENSKIPEEDENDNCSSKTNLSMEVNSFNIVRKFHRISTAPTKSENPRNKCPICNSFYKDKYILKNHMKRHYSEKKHECHECGKKFHTRTEVGIHMHSHSNEKSFLCSHCGLSFNRSSHLGTHIKRHFNQRNHKCEICDKSFYESNTLKRHMMGHSTERPYQCNTCPANFSRKSALSNHIKLHENKREYKCKLCDAGFNQKAGLVSHMKTTHKLT